MQKDPICSRNLEENPMQLSGCSSARLEYTSGGRGVAGSNPVIPTNRRGKILIILPLFCFERIEPAGWQARGLSWVRLCDAEGEARVWGVFDDDVAAAKELAIDDEHREWFLDQLGQCAAE